MQEFYSAWRFMTISHMTRCPSLKPWMLAAGTSQLMIAKGGSDIPSGFIPGASPWIISDAMLMKTCGLTLKIAEIRYIESVQTGVECFFDNPRLARWADVLFLCCLPSHLPKVCAEIRSHLSKRCLVYSFASAVPVTRLAQLLGHDFILKPQYDFVACDTADVWLSCTHMTAALTDPLLIEASCPLTMSRGISLGLNWVCAVLYSLLNICTCAGLGSSDALSLINGLFKEKYPHTVELNAQSFISSSYTSSLLTEEPFPWISLTVVQTKETPLLRFLSSNKYLQQCISAAYKSLLEETPEKSHIKLSCKT
ncbi:NADP-dependent oxidoreductase domain-containing protein 1 isoform X4 [Larimichthys crocea]|uniref:NADP-dependent oxidoreductase domain-containing protein 1 isoform X4 n=1 Tax=Larimichthys crocea TaxID=215358 RepID=UPI000F5F48F2|nr:NADP-dependent oxidoreductase domain-containing protein 1 isoform X4 [Larimichthys crocea]